MVDDASAVTQLVLAERQGRDRGWWEQMASCAEVLAGWLEGTAS